VLERIMEMEGKKGEGLAALPNCPITTSINTQN
jgi:hypothetical protein